MKALLALFLTTTVACVRQTDANAEARDGLPLADNHTWPSAIKDAPSFEPQRVQLSSLPKAMQQEIIAYYEEDVGPDNYSRESFNIFQFDLNNDGNKELFVYEPVYSGTGGESYFILSPSNTGVKKIGFVHGWQFTFCERKNGWCQIEAIGGLGVNTSTRALLTFDGIEYVITKSE